MKKIVLIERLGFAAIKLQRLVESSLKDVEFKVADGKKLQISKSNTLFADADLILLDLDQSYFDLSELVVSLKASQETAQIPVIVISSNSDFKTLRQAIGSGCQDFLLKPFSEVTLMTKINKWLYAGTSTVNDYKKQYSKNVQLESSISLVWNDAFKTGIEEIDMEHKRIVDSYERLYNLMKEGKGHAYYKELVEFLDNYVHEHFEHEEIFQKSFDYENYEEHCQLHKVFKSKVKAIIDSHESKDVSNIDVINISVFIKDILLHHILLEDLKIAEAYRKL